MGPKNVLQLIGVALAAASLTLLTACSEPYVDYEPKWEPTTEAPAVTFEPILSRLNSVLKIGYTIRNVGTEPVVAYVGLRGDPKSDPRDVYVTVREDGVVELAKRTFLVPDGLTVNDDSPNYIEGVVLAPGAEFAEEFQVGLPLKANRPYSNFDGERMPDPVSEVVFCVGAVLETDAKTLGSVGAQRNKYPITGAQHLFCSQPTKIDG